LSVGVLQDSNVSLDELDRNSGEGDTASQVKAKLGYSIKLPSNTKLDFQYQISDRNYQEFNQVDRQQQLFSARLKHKFKVYRVGATLRKINVDLDGKDYLTINQINPYISRYFGKKIYLRMNYEFGDKIYDGLPERNADDHQLATDVYFFKNGLRHYYVASFRLKKVDANSVEFDYGSYILKTKVVHRVSWGERDIKLSAGWRFEKRDYDAITPSIDTKRSDDKHRLYASFKIPITELTYLSGKYEYSDYSSNLPSADYTQNVFYLKFGIKF